MANDTGGFGLRPARHYKGASSWQVEKWYVHADYGTAIFVGDPILYQPATAYQDPTGVHLSAAVSAGTTGTMINGVCVGIEPIQTDLNKTYMPASTGGYIYVMTGPDVVYEVRDNGAGTPTKTFVGQNCDLVATAAGSTITGLSGFELNAAAVSTDQADAVHIIGIANKADNTLADDVIWLVRLNTSENAAGLFDGVAT